MHTHEKYLQGKIKLEYLAGKVTPADRLTKLGTAKELKPSWNQSLSST
jgi:hypothetical protein